MIYYLFLIIYYLLLIMYLFIIIIGYLFSFHWKMH